MTADDSPVDPVTLLGHLADESRLRVFAAVLLGAQETAAVAERSGVPEKDALRLLARLESAGLVERADPGWLARPHRLRDSVANAAPVRDVVDHGAVDPDQATVLRTFMPSGRLEQIPAARNKRLVVLDHICRAFEPGVRYPEREVTAMLKAFHPDYAALRRYLVDEGFLARESGTYWRTGGTVHV
ncbi:MAG: hypothetical protein QOH80_929 [Actinomycetota bacterium]|nr:hypothetical protein [Actinomycetota bacterium]